LKSEGRARLYGILFDTELGRSQNRRVEVVKK